MKKLSIALAIAALFAANAFAQADKPGEDKALTAKPATAAEKAAAKSARKAEGAATAKSAKADDTPANMGKAKGHTKSERKSAAAKRKAEGAKATKEPKDVSGPNS